MNFNLRKPFHTVNKLCKIGVWPNKIRKLRVLDCMRSLFWELCQEVIKLRCYNATKTNSFVRKGQLCNMTIKVVCFHACHFFMTVIIPSHG